MRQISICFCFVCRHPEDYFTHIFSTVNYVLFVNCECEKNELITAIGIMNHRILLRVSVMMM